MSDDLDSIIWDTFVVRVWHETAHAVWRGEIIHLPDRASLHFASFAQAEAFMQRYVSAMETGPPVGGIESASDSNESTATSTQPSA